MRRIDPTALGVFLILLGSYAFFWHSRDWNTASRLMLTYSLVDRGTVAITGLERQTLDLAKFGGGYYSDKFPGYSLLAVAPYAVLKSAFHFPAHPLGVPAMPYWPADYWVTLATSGLLTAFSGVLLVLLARDLGCAPGISAMVGLAYGLSTPAYVYATLAYGHQAAAFALLASFLLIWKKSPRFSGLRLGASGFLAAQAPVIELQVGPVSAILGFYLLIEVVRRRYTILGLADFVVGAMIPTLVLLAYNQRAFGSPWDMGYAHHVTFANVHPDSNPLGLESPNWRLLGELLVGRYRGLFVYAPVLILAVPGWIVLLARKSVALAIVSLLVCLSVLLVNLSYPEWTGGWSTGPRLLVPMIPFAMIPVAGLLARPGRLALPLNVAAAGLALIGGTEMLLFQGAGARIPHQVFDVRVKDVVGLKEPLRDAVWPLWAGERRPPRERHVDGFARNLVAVLAPGWVRDLPPGWRFLQVVPLALAQCLAIAIVMAVPRRRAVIPEGATTAGPL